MTQPKYMHIYNWLSEQIKNKQFAPGERMPSEVELAARFNVHRMTVRQAINKLVADHLIVRKRNRGTFLLSDRRPVLTRILDSVSTYHEDIVRAGLEPGYQTIDARIVDYDDPLVGHLETKPDKRIVFLHRVFLASGVPIAIERSYLPESVFPGIIGHNLNTMLYGIMKKHYGVIPSYSKHEIGVVNPGAVERKRLRITRDIPCLLVGSLVYDSRDRVIEVSEALFRGDKYRFKCSMQRVPGKFLSLV